MAIIIWNSYTLGSWTTSTNTLTISHTITEWNNRILFAIIPESRATTITSAKFNWVDMTLLNSWSYSTQVTFIYYLKSPPVWTYDLTIVMWASLQYRYIWSLDLKWVDLINTFWNGVALTWNTWTSNYNVSMASTVNNSLFLETHATWWTVSDPGSWQTVYSWWANRLWAYKFITTVWTQTLNWIVWNWVNWQYSHLINEVKPALTNWNFFNLF
jgi:hypothetical protein